MEYLRITILKICNNKKKLSLVISMKEKAHFNMPIWNIHLFQAVILIFFCCHNGSKNCQLLTLFLLGGGQFDPPCSFFLHNSKSTGLRLLKFSDFSYIPKALLLVLKPGFNTNCLSPQAHCLNDCFFL